MNQLMDWVTHQKYDKSLEDIITMYDNQEYKKDSDLITEDKIMLVSGNVLKYYTFQYNTREPYLIQTQDDFVQEKIAQMQAAADAAKKKQILSSQEESDNQTEDQSEDLVEATTDMDM